MTRVALAVMIVILAPALAVAGGGVNPPPEELGFAVGGPVITASIIMDPHEFGVTSTAKQGFITIRSGRKVSATAFLVDSQFPLFLGCDRTLTQARFLNLPLDTLMFGVDYFPYVDDGAGGLVPGGNLVKDVIDKLFLGVGVTVQQTTMIPFIQKIKSDHCIPDPFNRGPLVDLGFGRPGPGIFHLEATIRFLVDPNNPN